MNWQELVKNITELQKNSITTWKINPIKTLQEGVLGLVEENHSFNFQLWNAEDRARREDMGFEFVYSAKREIDHYNQQRNNRMEAIDNALFHLLQPAESSNCPVHSETPGMMIDRLSILALKMFHMHLQVIRPEVDENHRNLCREKYFILQQQQTQLETCLLELLQEVSQKTRTFRLYRQFKMYNDPKLNPELYGAQTSA